LIAAVTSKLSQQQFDEDPFLRNFLKDACISWLSQKQIIISQLNVFVKCGLVNSLEKFISFEGQAKSQPKEEKEKISSNSFSSSLFQLLSDLLELEEQTSTTEQSNSISSGSSSLNSNPRDSMNSAAQAKSELQQQQQQQQQQQNSSSNLTIPSSSSTITTTSPPTLQSMSSSGTLRNLTSKSSQLELAVLSTTDSLIRFGNFDQITQKNVLSSNFSLEIIHFIIHFHFFLFL